ncbi:hypothetical protein AVEN_248803-1 [Araneus ventricosus]|uniref:Uncharacterized protein n=1 Tax=Araneus ventricosus TaxID=182803 RepID=A0A4Y2TH65_ARAVE|nr:hypothetical protein AVEN_85558-1 [Araneus ventricosus]GBO00046.1 hypothetical protein AVEN_248803-1 [Araneus ventricosus]
MESEHAGEYLCSDSGKFGLSGKFEQYSADLEKSSRKVPAEDEFVTLYPDGEATDYSNQETDSETDVEDNPVHEECRDSNSNTNVCIIHPINF